MAAHALLDITTGAVTSVAFSSEAAEGAPAYRRLGAALTDAVVNVMQLVLTDDAGKTHRFEFRNTTVGVKEGHVVAVVRAKKAGLKGPLTLMLVNRTTGQRDEFPKELRAAASQKGLRARWKALFAALLIGISAFGVSHVVTFGGQHVEAAIGLGLLAGVGAFVLLWGAIALSDQIRLPAKDRAEVQRLRAEVTAKLFAPSPPSAPSAFSHGKAISH
jgi:hypothetical protein